MEESPEQARYMGSLELFYIDQEKHPFPDTFVFVPAPRRFATPLEYRSLLKKLPLNWFEPSTPRRLF
jgi:hypothetical protein